jgi:hypothetical protein
MAPRCSVNAYAMDAGRKVKLALARAAMAL